MSFSFPFSPHPISRTFLFSVFGFGCRRIQYCLLFSLASDGVYVCLQTKTSNLEPLLPSRLTILELFRVIEIIIMTILALLRPIPAPISSYFVLQCVFSPIWKHVIVSSIRSFFPDSFNHPVYPACSSIHSSVAFPHPSHPSSFKFLLPALLIIKIFHGQVYLDVFGTPGRYFFEVEPNSCGT